MAVSSEIWRKRARLELAKGKRANSQPSIGFLESVIAISGMYEEFRIPEGIKLSTPRDDERAYDPPPGKVAFNASILRVIGGLPVHPTVA